jgi:hypothetical protein
LMRHHDPSRCDPPPRASPGQSVGVVDIFVAGGRNRLAGRRYPIHPLDVPCTRAPIRLQHAEKRGRFGVQVQKIATHLGSAGQIDDTRTPTLPCITGEGAIQSCALGALHPCVFRKNSC